MANVLTKADIKALKEIGTEAALFAARQPIGTDIDWWLKDSTWVELNMTVAAVKKWASKRQYEIRNAQSGVVLGYAQTAANAADRMEKLWKQTRQPMICWSRLENRQVGIE